MLNCSSPKCSPKKGLGILFLRVIVGIIFLSHGVQKLNNMDQTIQFFGSLNFVPFLAYLVAWVETLGGISLILGIFIPIFAPLLSIVMIVAIFSVKKNQISLQGFGKAELDFALLGATVALSVLKGGACSLTKICKCGCGETTKKKSMLCKLVGCGGHNTKCCLEMKVEEGK